MNVALKNWEKKYPCFGDKVKKKWFKTILTIFDGFHLYLLYRKVLETALNDMLEFCFCFFGSYNVIKWNKQP